MVVSFLLVAGLVLQIFPDEPSNILVLTALEVNHAPQSVCEKDDAESNMRAILITLDTSHSEMSLLNDDAELNMSSMLVTLDTSHLEMSPLKDDAKANMSSMLVTLDTSHLEMSQLNNEVQAALLNHLERSTLSGGAK